MDDDVLVAWQRRNVRRQFAQRNQLRAIDPSDLVLVRLAHVDQLEHFATLKAALQFMHVYFIDVVLCRLRPGSAKEFVIDRSANARMFATDRALRIAAQLELAELHLR